MTGFRAMGFWRASSMLAGEPRPERPAPVSDCDRYAVFLDFDGTLVEIAPTPDFRAIAGYLAFYAGKMDACFVGQTRAEPQPGGFYGGWVTPEIVGPFKGGPGTMGW